MRFIPGGNSSIKEKILIKIKVKLNKAVLIIYMRSQMEDTISILKNTAKAVSSEYPGQRKFQSNVTYIQISFYLNVN